jgi:hypothetical protein
MITTHSLVLFTVCTLVFTVHTLYTRLAWAGGTCPHFAWAGGTFFPVVLLCQFLVLAGNRFWLYILLCIYVRGLAKMFWPNTSGYIVGTYIISD